MKKFLGFSLLEITLTLFIAAIVAVFSVSSFESIFKRSEQTILREQLMRSIAFSRNEAIVLGETITLCKSENQKTCGGEWSDGYLVLSNARVLFSFRNQKHHGVLHWRAFPYFLEDLEFLSGGTPNFQNGTFWYCTRDTKNPLWAILLSQSGRAREVYPDKNGEILDERGDALGC